MDNPAFDNLTKVMSDLTRAKAEFQLRALTAVLGGEAIIRLTDAGEHEIVDPSQFYVSPTEPPAT